MQEAGSNPQDHWITRALQRGDHRRALELLARAYAAELGRLCHAMTGDQAEAEELTQEILIVAYRAMPGFGGRASVRTWLYTIARRTCSRAVQKQRRRCRILAAVDLAPGQRQARRSQEEQHLARHQLREALAQLSVDHQEVLLLRHVSGLSYREVGQVCGIREAAARQRVASGLGKLRRLLAVDTQRPRSCAENEQNQQNEQNERVVAACQEL